MNDLKLMNGEVSHANIYRLDPDVQSHGYLVEDYGQVNPEGGVLPQATSSSRAKGRTILRLRTLALIVVHKHAAASKASTPCNTGQHWFTTGSPRPTCTNPPNTSTQAPSLRVSRGQVAGGGAEGVGSTTGGGVAVSGGGAEGVVTTGGGVAMRGGDWGGNLGQ